jgi:hypothetical protein
MRPPHGRGKHGGMELTGRRGGRARVAGGALIVLGILGLLAWAALGAGIAVCGEVRSAAFCGGSAHRWTLFGWAAGCTGVAGLGVVAADRLGRSRVLGILAGAMAVSALVFLGWAAANLAATAGG